MPSVPKYYEKKAKPWLILGFSIIILILFVATFFIYRAGTGKAVAIGETPWISGTIDLTKEESVTFTAPLTAVTRNVSINTSLATYDNDSKNYEFNFSRLDTLTYNFLILNSEGTILARDILNINGDRTIVHLNADDPIPDLEVSLLNGRITVKNLHYISSDISTITFVNTNGVPYSSIVQVNESQVLKGIINASSTSSPRITINNIGTLNTLEVNLEGNYTQANFTYTAPATSTAEILDITATVQSKDTHAYYTFAVGNRIFVLNETGFPQMTLSLIADTTAQLNVTFNGNNLLQPFALPCELTDTGASTVDTVSRLFNGTNVDKVYTYNSAGQYAEVWSQNSPVNELTDFAAFNGYFVRLKNPTETKISTICTVQTLKSPLVPTFSGTAQTKNLASGWSLVSLPGIVPLHFAGLTTGTNFTVYECKEGYQCSTYTGPLNPGKPYWVKSPIMRLQYILE